MTNKKTILIILIITILIGGGIFYFVKNKPADIEQKEFPYPIDFSTAKNIPEEQLKRLKDDYERAKIKYLENSTNFDALMTFAFIYYQLGEYGSARDTYVKIGEMDPKGYNVFWNLGNTCLRLNDYACAEKAYLKAIENGPEQTRHYIALAELYWYHLPDKKNQIPDIYKKGLEKLPGNYDLLIGLAQYYKEAGDKENALKYYQEIIEKYPDLKGQIEEEIKSL